MIIFEIRAIIIHFWCYRLHMVEPRKKNSHLWDRDPNDWYVEPESCSRALLNVEHFKGGVWDPACGTNRIVDSSREAGLYAIGSDLMIRNEKVDFQANFLEQTRMPDMTNNIVSNPPFGIAEEFYHHGLELLPMGGKLAFILPMVWLSGFSKKRDWLPTSPLRKYFAISPRPSMPPGAVIQAGIKAGNGTKDFAWFVWEKGFKGKAEVGFLNTNPYKD